ncbi:hypothetical protein [Mycolicibacter kumamotonensis]|uniref:Uncharacterized protein n=1 Tax=Mycolicibacter kumamotonensis TaxID=354243 RepID=A0A1B8SG50_9MYCO|nr:hypothetical protein [Mycolicibacter kumamotonensis]NDJ88901.1 hypothetical protein [Mycolicibacter kumamotonensis]OBY31694.1 hypothetical protein ACT18_11245 [Mycolicibacter kumamotonensis]ORA78283.1 hypothetical protein BST28_15200 [Mycolicibacter kumamotonensis]
MNRRIQAATLAATAGGGLLTAAFLHAAVAIADSSDAGFTIGDISFTDPVAIDALTGGQTDGYEALTPMFANSPLLSLGSDSLLGLFSLGSQQFTIEDSSGETLGTLLTSTNVQNLLGIVTAQFTVTSSTAAGGLTAAQAAELPADGTVYSITNLGGGFANVYVAVPNADGTAASSITNTFVTPFGNFDLPTPYDAIAPLDPGAPLESLGNTSGVSGLSDNAFTIDGTTFDPGSDGIDLPTRLSLSSFAPLLSLQASAINISGSGLAGTQADQEFTVYADGADAGTIHSYLWYSDVLGIDSTQFTVGAIAPANSALESALAAGLDFGGAEFTAQELADALSANSAILRYGSGDITGNDVLVSLLPSGLNLAGSDITNDEIASVLNNIDLADLPAVGTVYSVTDLGGGFANVYEAVPGAGGGSATITDTLVTPFGNLNIPTTFDATSPLDPAAPLGALAATSDSAALSDNAFTIGGTTFDPGSDGFSTDASYPLFGIAPLLQIAGVNALGAFLPTQDGISVYDDDGATLGTVSFGENMSNILGIETTQFTVTSVDAASGLTDAQIADLPTLGTVYSVTDLWGFTNVYEAIPNADGTAASSITDTLITPFGTFDLSGMFSMFDAVAPLDAGDAVSGLDAAGAAAAGFDLFDPGSWF